LIFLTKCAIILLIDCDDRWFGKFSKCPLTRICKRLDRLEDGNFGNCKSVGAGVFELFLHFGPGSRTILLIVIIMIILLLCGGDKSSQKQDITRAKNYWEQYKEAQG